MRHTKTCPRCNGKGSIGVFAHRDGGICYCCKGKGIIKATEEEHKQLLRTAEILANPVIEWSELYGRLTGKHGDETYFIAATRISLGYGKTKKGFGASVVGKKYNGYGGYISSACNSIEEAKALCERYAQDDLVPNLVVHNQRVKESI